MISILVRIISITRMKLLMLPKAKLLTWEGFKGDKTFPQIILLAKWVYQLSTYIKKLGFFQCKSCVSVRPVSYWLELKVMGIT